MVTHALCKLSFNLKRMYAIQTRHVSAPHSLHMPTICGILQYHV